MLPDAGAHLFTGPDFGNLPQRGIGRAYLRVVAAIDHAGQQLARREALAHPCGLILRRAADRRAHEKVELLSVGIYLKIEMDERAHRPESLIGEALDHRHGEGTYLALTQDATAQPQ